MKKEQKIGMLSAFIGGILWGINGTMASFLFINKNITPNWLAPYRLMTAGFLMLIFLYFKKRNKIFDILKSKKDIMELVFFSIFGMMGTQYTYFTTIRYSNAGIATVLQYLGINLILIYVCFKEKRFPKKVELLALVLAILGVFILATHGNINALQISPKALIWGLASALTLVVYSMSPLNLIKKYGTALITAWGMAIGGPILTLYAKPWNELGNYDMTTFTVFSLIVIFGTILSFVLYLSGVAIIGPTKGSLISCIEPVAATLFSTIFIGTPFKFLDGIGFLFILSTVFIIAYFDSKK